MALELSIVADGCGLVWDAAKGPSPLVLLPKLPSARAEAAYVSEVVIYGRGHGLHHTSIR